TPAAWGQSAQLTVVYDATLRQLRLYLNGVLAAARVGVTVLDSTGPMTLGRMKWNGAGTDFLKGFVDDVRVFSRALSDSEVRAIHNDVPAVGLSFWRFDDGTARDFSPRGDNATATGGFGFPAGVSGLGLGLDGVSGAATTAYIGVA